MAKGNDKPTEEADNNVHHTTGSEGNAAEPTGTNKREEQSEGSVSRRRLLQAGAVGLASTVAVATVSGNETDHPNTIVFDGTGSSGKSKYTFSVSGGVEPNSDAGTIEVKDAIDGSSVSGAVHRDKDAYRFSGDLTALDIKGSAGVSINYGDSGDIQADRLQIVAGSDASVDYSFTTTDKTVRVTGGDNPAEDSDEVVENSDGTWTVTGDTGSGNGDTFDFWGEITDFSPMEGSYTLFRNGTEVTSYDLTGEEPPETREHSYSFEGTGDSWADYYLEVEDGAEMIATTLDGAVVEPDFHWVSDDGTKAAGRVDPGERHAYEFDNLVLDVTIEGEADAFVDGSPSNLDYYPQPGATGDGWKGGFPWQQVDVEREHSYSFEGTGDSWADYYLEVEDGAEMIATELDGAVVEPDFHWVSDDGTKAAGRVDPGERHAYEFDNLVLDVTVDGDADAFVDGSPSNLDYYPQPGATGDGWKGGFPWQDREHSYSFEGTGDSWADYYLEVEDGGELFASRLDGAIVEPDFHWISTDRTKAAGRVDPGERHAYEFDNLVLDVTIEGEADAFVDGSPSNLDYYPQSGATGDGWKGGFPWQDGEETTETSGPVMGGGPGYANTVTQSEADTVVRTRSALADALANATAGDVVFVPGGEQIDMQNRQHDIPDGVTLASDRGVDGSEGALLYNDGETPEVINIPGSGRLTGVRLRGPHPGDDTDGEAGGGVQTLGAGEVDNCEIWGFALYAIQADGGDGAHFHHNVLRENNRSGLGYGVAAGSGTPLIEYNYFNFNRHSVKSTGQNPGYTVRYNHFGPKSTGGVIDVHDPAGIDLEVHNNVVEPVVSTSGHRDPLQSIQIRGTPDEAYDVHNNWFWNDMTPRDSPNGWTNESIIQATEDNWENINWWDNHYGKDAAVTYEDCIPGYDGWRSP